MPRLHKVGDVVDQDDVLHDEVSAAIVDQDEVDHEDVLQEDEPDRTSALV